jgi:hypothetical protein
MFRLDPFTIPRKALSDGGALLTFSPFINTGSGTLILGQKVFETSEGNDLYPSVCELMHTGR